MKIKLVSPEGKLFRDRYKQVVYELNNEQLRGMLAAVDFVYDREENKPGVFIHPVNVKIPESIYEEIKNRKDINATAGEFKYQIGIRRNSNDRFTYYNFIDMDFLKGLLAGLFQFLESYKVSSILTKHTLYKDL